MKALVVTAVLSLLTVGCTHSIHQQHVSDMDADLVQTDDVKTLVVTAEQSVVLGFVFDTNYVDQAYAQLRQQCPGRIAAVATQHSTSHGFLSWTNKIRMEALCKP